MAEIVLTRENFEADVMQSSLPVLIDFWATWCGPCKMIAPIVEELAKDNEGKLVVAKADVDEDPILAQQFGIQSIPTLVLVKDGKTVEMSVGLRQKAQLQAMIDPYI